MWRALCSSEAFAENSDAESGENVRPCGVHLFSEGNMYLAHQTLEDLKLDESCTSNQKSQKFKLDGCPFRLARPI